MDLLTLGCDPAVPGPGMQACSSRCQAWLGWQARSRDGPVCSRFWGPGRRRWRIISPGFEKVWDACGCLEVSSAPSGTKSFGLQQIQSSMKNREADPCESVGTSSIPQQGESSWTAQISQYVKGGHCRQALQTYEQMRELRVKPSSFTFVAALKACSRLQDLERCKQIHAHVVEDGFDSSIYVGNTLLDVYAKCGSLVDAWQVFENMSQRTVVSWNTMILGYAQRQQGEVALTLYAQMRQQGIVPTDRTFVGALKACSTIATMEQGQEGHVKDESLKQARMIHADLRRGGFESDVFVGTMLVDVYAKCGSLVDARCVFDNMTHRDVVSWNAVILAYAQLDQGEVALQLYTQMQQENMVPNDRTFVAVLKACSSLAALEEGDESDRILVKKRCLDQARGIHSAVKKTGYESDGFVANMLVDVYAKCGSLMDARRVFEKMPNRDVVSWTAMILGYAQMEQGDEALQLYERMQLEGVAPNDRTFVGALKGCSSLALSEQGNKNDGNMKKRCLEKARAIHSAVLKMEFHTDVFVGTMLVDVYVKCGSLSEARDVFEKMSPRDVACWNAMILGYAQMDAGELALELYARMQQEAVVPNDRTFIAVLTACGAVVGLEKGKEIHAQISKSGLGATDLFVQTALIDMYGKCGSMEDAKQVFDAMPRRNVVPWTALIAGYAHQGDSKLVFDLFERMRQEGIQPNAITFLRVLTLCNHVGLVDKGQKYFEVMSRDYGITPTAEHYNCMIDLLGRAGQVEKAMEMAKTMHVPPSGTLWRCVLAACQKWKNLEVGKEAFECAVKIDRNDAAAYVLMSNIYAAAGMVENAKELQATRKEIRARKKQGQSWWTEVDGFVHSFSVDTKHPETQYVHRKLRDLLDKMMEEGCVPHRNSTVSGKPIDEKAKSLFAVSEKLRGAYALLNTSPQKRLNL